LIPPLAFLSSKASPLHITNLMTLLLVEYTACRTISGEIMVTSSVILCFRGAREVKDLTTEKTIAQLKKILFVCLYRLVAVPYPKITTTNIYF
jgi:hypothetical protein